MHVVLPSDNPSKTFEIKVTNSNSRLDIFLSIKLPKYSRTKIKKMIDQGNATIDGKPARSSSLIQDGQTIKFTIKEPLPTTTLHPFELNLDVIFENENIILINKPAGLTVHPTPTNTTKTLANAIVANYPEIKFPGTKFRPGIVHRLDKDTSGILIISKNEESHIELSNQFKTKQINKVYIGLVDGHIRPKEAIIEGNIGRHPTDRKKMCVITDGKHSVTKYREIMKYPNHSLLEISPLTGRTHQIRVHLNSIGYSIVGDELYGKANENLERQFLHAKKIGFKMPFTKTYVEFECPLAPDLKNLLEIL
mgnify:CR=1 FL=1|tara:strand:+ start:4996 stop:5919 length:924 start_codon:yes stop_codon:yes gene_type:complete